MNRALPMLAVAALFVMLLETAPHESVVLPGVLGTVYVAWSELGYRWAQRHGRPAAVGYLLVALALGFAVFDVAGAGVGSTLLLLVVVVQAVVLLPLGWAVGVALLVPFVHVGMPMADGLRQVVATALACAFAFVLAALHLREQQARSELAVANARLHELGAQTEELATMRERTRVARDIHDGLGHHLTVVGMQVQAARAVLASDPDKADRLLGQAEEQARQALRSVRESVTALREPRPAEPLPQQLRTLAAEVAAAGLPTEVDVEGEERRLEGDAQVAELEDILREGRARVVRPGRAMRFSRVVIDGRSAAPGDLYVAIRGAAFDGHDFCAQAVAAGATGVVVAEDRVGKDIPDLGDATVVAARDPRQLLGDVARFHRRAGARSSSRSPARPARRRRRS